MKIFLRLSLSLTILAAFLQVRAQTEFSPGYIITYANDTIQGAISYAGDSICNFRQNNASEVKKFKPAHIAGFRFTGGKYFVSKDVITNKIRNKVFLDLLVDGLADLYCKKEGSNSRYFIQKPDGAIIELIEKDDEYIDALKFSFSDCPRIFHEINSTPLKYEPLMYLTRKYNRFVSSEKNVFIVKPPMVKVLVGPFVSANKSFMNYENSILYEAFDFKSWIYPSAGLVINTSFPRLMRILSFQVSGEVGRSHFYANAYNPYSSKIFEEVNLHMLTFKSKAGFKFTYPKGKFRPSLMIGASMVNTLNKDCRRLEDSFQDPVIFINVGKENVSANNIYGYAFDLGFDYHHSSKFISFFSIGSTIDTGGNYGPETYLFKYDSDRSLITNNITLNINAGFYF